MNWRYIPFRKYDPYFKTGLNKAVMESVADGSDPVVFLSGWQTNCVNIGYSQGIKERVNLEEVEKRDDVVIVRRQGGGGTTYLTEKGEITWHLVAPAHYFPADVNETYRKICGEIASGLETIGINARHEPINDIVTENGKISGATLKRNNGVTYVAGTLLYEVEPEEMFSLINPDEEKKERKQVEDYRERVTSVKQESGASFQETRNALKQAILNGKQYEETSWTEQEINRAETLANKYSGEEWIYRR